MMLRRGGRLSGVAFGFLLAALAVTPVQAKDYAQKFREAIEAAKKGDAAGAIKVFEKDAGKDRDKDKLLCLYEMGAMYQIMGNWEKSAETFEKARSVEDEYDLRARASASGAGHQIGAVLTNDRALMYYGSDYERVMCHTLNAVNYLLKNDIEGAAVEIRKADEYQKKCEERARLAAEKARGKQEGSNPQGADQEKEPTPQDEAQAEQVMQNSPGLSQAFAPMDQFTAGIRNSYQNTFTYYLSGIVYESQGDKEGYNDAAIDLKKAYDLAPDAPAIRTAYLYNIKRFDTDQYKVLSAQMHETASDLPTTEFGTLVVLYEAGLVPEKQEVKVDLPIRGNLLSFAFPIYSRMETAQYDLSVSAGGQSVATERVLDMRPLAVKALVEQRKGIVTRAIARAIVKAAATKEAGKQLGWLGRLAGEIYTFASNRADIRSWYSLPAEVRAARLYLPPGDTEIGLSNMTDKVKVNIQPGAVTLLMVRGIEGAAHAKQVTLTMKPGHLPSPETPPAMVAALAPLQSGPAFASESGAPPQDPAASVPGKYIRQGKSSDFIELYPDGAFSILQDEKISAGKYGVQGDAITWTAPWIAQGQSGAHIIGNTIKDDDGSVWEKQVEPQKATVADPTSQPAEPHLERPVPPTPVLEPAPAPAPVPPFPAIDSAPVQRVAAAPGSLEALSEVVARGEEVVLKIKYDYAVYPYHYLHEGLVTVSKASVAFRPTIGDLDFKVSPDKILEVNDQPQQASRVHMKVTVKNKKGDKENKKDFYFYNLSAITVGAGPGGTGLSIACNGCDNSMNVLYALIEKVRAKS